MVSYSQFGEDLLVQEILGYERKDIFYIELGAYQPISKSNTYIFYKRGGRGICVEPNPLAKKLWERIRPRDIFVNAGVTGGVTCCMDYITDNAAAGMNHFCVESENGDSNKIKVFNIRELLELYLPAGKNVDFLTIDCEGMDLQILESFPFEKVRPRVVAVEDFDYSEQSRIHLLMSKMGYEMKSYAKITKIFVDLLN
jgi:hypothetical protein